MSDLTPTTWPTDSMLWIVNFVTHPCVLPISALNGVTTLQLALDPISVSICVPTFVPTSVTIRHLVLDPITVRNPAIPIFVTVRHIVLELILNFVTIHHLVLNPSVHPNISNCRATFVSIILFTLLSVIVD